jgi:serine protease Do
MIANLRFSLAAMLSLCCGLGAASAFAQNEAEALSASFRKAAQRVSPAVVTVRPSGPVRPVAPFFNRAAGGPLLPLEAGGSGVVIDAERGFVLTNDHVVGGLSRVSVILPDGRERIASQVRRDPRSDLALLVIDPKGLTQAEWGDSDALAIGDWVLAIGQPYGQSATVTAGIVSGKGRGAGLALFVDMIQTDAAINPANSGGPLVNLKGQIVGINVAIRSIGGGFEGIGFAVPARRARRFAAELAEHGQVRRGHVGVQIGEIDPVLAERIGQPGAVVVNGVAPGSPANKAGLIAGDIILKLNGKTVEGGDGLQATIEDVTPGEPMTLTIDRDGERREVTVKPEAQPERFGRPDEPARRPERPEPKPEEPAKKPKQG